MLSITNGGVLQGHIVPLFYDVSLPSVQFNTVQLDFTHSKLKKQIAQFKYDILPPPITLTFIAHSPRQSGKLRAEINVKCYQ